MSVASVAAPTVYRDRVEPHWSLDSSRFWYRNALRDGASEFVMVDAVKGTRLAAFDHARVAEALGKAAGVRMRADQLPIESMNLDAPAGYLILTAKGKAWRLDLKSYEVQPWADTQPTATLKPIGDRPRQSREGGGETSIAFENRLDRRVDIFWLDTRGKRVAYGAIEPGERWGSQTYVGHVWLVADASGASIGVYEAEAAGGSVIVDGKPATTRPSRRAIGRRDAGRSGPESPDGKWVALVRENNLFIRAKSGSEEFALSRDGKAGDGYSPGQWWWSPDSLHLVAMRTEAGQEHPVYTLESSPKDQVQPKLRTLNYLKPGDRIDHPRPRLFDIANRKALAIDEALFANPWSISEVRWSADSSRFTFVYNQRGHQSLRVIAVSAVDGSARAIVDERSATFIDYSGKYFCQWVGDDELIWMSERDGWNHLWLYDANAGKVKNAITSGEYVVQSIARVDESKRQIWFRAGGMKAGQDPYYSHFCRINFDGTGLTMLTEADGTHAAQWSPDNRYFIDSWSRVDQPPVNELRWGDTGALVCKLEEADASDVLAARGGRWPERFVAKGRDGVTDIYGVIIYPRDYDEARKYPVVENIYAGPQDFFAPKAFRARLGHQQNLADRGMIVVQCDGMGTSGRSKKFHDVCWKNLRDAGFPDRIAWIKSAAASHPQMDLGRVGIYGGSAGGQNAMAAVLWHHDFYKVAVADCGCHDNRMDKIWWNEQWMGWPIGPEYEANSNVVNAGLLGGKLMLIVGEMDDNVDPASTMQVVSALEKADKDFELVIVAGAHHGAGETAYGSRRRAEFLARNLVGPDKVDRGVKD